MMGRHQRRRRQRGMTMIEVLVSMAILVMMLVAVWSTFNSTLRGIEVTEKSQERSMVIRTSISRMTSELSMAYLSFNRPQAEPRHFTYFEGRSSGGNGNVTFSSFAHLRMRKDANESDQSLIQYFVADDPDDSSRQHLYRRESRRLTGDLPEELEKYFPAYVVLEDVDSLELEYWDQQTEEWLDEWSTVGTDGQPDRLPQRVKIKIGVMENGEVIYYSAQTILFMQEKIDLGR